MYYFFLFWQNCTFKHTECALFPYFGKLVYLIIERIANVVPCHFLVMDSVVSGQNHKLWFTTPLDKSLVSLLSWIRGPVEWERGVHGIGQVMTSISTYISRVVSLQKWLESDLVSEWQSHLKGCLEQLKRKRKRFWSANIFQKYIWRVYSTKG